MNSLFKICPDCNTEKPRTEFKADRRNRDGLVRQCRVCWRVIANRWQRANPDKRSASRRRYNRRHVSQKKLRDQQYYAKNKVRILGRGKIWQEKNPGKVAAAKRNWAARHPEKVRECYRKFRIRHKATPLGKLNCLMRTGIFRSLRSKKANRHWETLVGYSLPQLKIHLESLFTEGMTWELLRQGKIHIDHIFPLSRLVFDSAEDPTFKYAWSLENLQPLWALENVRKGNKVPWEFELGRRIA